MKLVLLHCVAFVANCHSSFAERLIFIARAQSLYQLSLFCLAKWKRVPCGGMETFKEHRYVHPNSAQFLICIHGRTGWFFRDLSETSPRPLLFDSRSLHLIPPITLHLRLRPYQGGVRPTLGTAGSSEEQA